MAKRMTDTEKWKRPWFQDLPVSYKMLWLYILDNCDNAGVWYVNLRVAGFMIGADLDIDMALHFLKKQIIVADEGNRWVVKDYVSFQYGRFSENSNVHKSVLRALQHYGLTWQDPESLRTLDPLDVGPGTLPGSPKDKDKVLDKAKAKAQVKDKDRVSVGAGRGN